MWRTILVAVVALVLVAGAWIAYIQNIECVMNFAYERGQGASAGSGGSGSTSELPGGDIFARRGQFGDAFGALTCIFTGFAVIAATVALFQQRQQAREDKTLALFPGFQGDHTAAGEAIRVLQDTVFRAAGKIAEKRDFGAYDRWMQLVAEILAGKVDTWEILRTHADTSLAGPTAAADPNAVLRELEGQVWTQAGSPYFGYVQGDLACFGQLQSRYAAPLEPGHLAGPARRAVRPIDDAALALGSQFGGGFLPLALCRRQVATFWERLGQLTQPDNFIARDQILEPAKVLRQFDPGSTLPHLLALTIKHREQIGLQPPRHRYGLYDLYVEWCKTERFPENGNPGFQEAFNEWLKPRVGGRT